MSRFARLANAVPRLVLSSPAHPLMSSRYAVLEFTGRRSGRRYRTPIAYLRQGSSVFISTDSPWWRNLAQCPRVRLRLRGLDVAGTARVVTDDQEAARILGLLVSGMRGYARPAGVHLVGGTAQEAELRRAVTSGGRRSIEIVLDLR